MGASTVVEGAKPVVAMVVVQVLFGGVNIFYKLAINDGMDMRVLVAYRYLFAAAFLVPLAFFVERKDRTKLTWRVVMFSFVCGLFGGSLAQNLYITSLKLTSATFASAMANLIPVITFVLAVLFRFEKLAIRTTSGQAKVLGTILGVTGAMLLTFYKGVEINPWHSHVDLLSQHHNADTAQQESGNQVVGALLAVASCFSYAIWLIIQAKLSREYPFHYSSSALMCVMSMIQAAVIAICVRSDLAQWRLGFDIRLLSVAYSGVLASGLMLVVLTWCVKRRGPLFGSVFNPLMLVVVAILSSVLLNEKLHLGSFLGAVLIVAGLYAVVWGKGREAARVGELPADESVHVVIHPISSEPQEASDESRDSVGPKHMNKPST